MSGRGRWIWAGPLVAGAVLLLGSCTWAANPRARAVGDTGAILLGEVHRDVGDVDPSGVTFWFEYGLTDRYGSTTPRRTDDATPPSGADVQDEIRGLLERTTYHVRLCVSDTPDGAGTCSEDRTLVTTGGEDSVIGDGVVTPPGDPFIRFKVSADARSAPGGASASGRAAEGESMNHAPDVGPVTCLRVDGNRATIGFLARSAYFDPVDLAPGQPRLVFIEDNGPSGDRFGTRDVDQVSSCPAATDADFPTITDTYPGDFAPIITGNFIVHDHDG